MKNGIINRLVILKAGIVYAFQEDTAYVTENWAAIISTVAYTLSFALFVKILYTNVDQIAGYSENDMYFFSWVAQMVFYSQFLTFENNISQLGDDVNSGTLDLLLTKPIPSLFYLSFKRISIVSVVRDGLPGMILLALLVNWGELDTTLQSIIGGIIIFLLGLSALYCFELLTIFPVFWIGKNEEIFLLGHRLQWLGRREIPFEGFGKFLQFSFTAVVPILITTGLTTSVILNKREIWSTVLFVSLVAILFQIFKTVVWKKALKAYTSASS
jgi:ABC-2 type transport system permease protein